MRIEKAKQEQFVIDTLNMLTVTRCTDPCQQCKREDGTCVCATPEENSAHDPAHGVCEELCGEKEDGAAKERQARQSGDRVLQAPRHLDLAMAFPCSENCYVPGAREGVEGSAESSGWLEVAVREEAEWSGERMTPML